MKENEELMKENDELRKERENLSSLKSEYCENLSSLDLKIKK